MKEPLKLYECGRCSDPATRGCVCERCSSEPEGDPERYQTCEACLPEVDRDHQRVRGRPAFWLGIRQGAPTDPAHAAVLQRAKNILLGPLPPTGPLDVLQRCRAELESQRVAAVTALARVDEAIAAVNALTASPSKGS